MLVWLRWEALWEAWMWEAWMWEEAEGPRLLERETSKKRAMRLVCLVARCLYVNKITSNECSSLVSDQI